MAKQFVWLLIIVLAFGVGWYVWPNKKVPLVPLSLSSDLYPLYDDLAWSAPVAESMLIGTTTYLGASVRATATTNTMDPGSAFTPFQKYYDQKLKSLGWIAANDLDAGGHVGGQTGYRKDSSVIMARFKIDYHVVSSSSPSECPCDVSLSLFSAGN